MVNRRRAQYAAALGREISYAAAEEEVVCNSLGRLLGNERVMEQFAKVIATRHNGALDGHYHNYGEIMKQLPDIMEDPLAIVRMNDNRLNLLAAVHTEKGENSILSVELNTVKDINSKYLKYNLIVSVIPSSANYMRNNLMKRGIKVEYEKEDLPQVNHQLHEWLAIVNERSSTVIIPDSETKSNPSEEKSVKKILESKYSLSDREGRDTRLFNLEAAKPFRDIVERYEREARTKKSSPGSITMSLGQYNAMRANMRPGKVYRKQDAASIADKIHILPLIRAVFLFKLTKNKNIFPNLLTSICCMIII